MNNYEQVLPTTSIPTSRGISVSSYDVSYILCMIVIFVGGFLLVWLVVQLYFAR